MFSMFLADQKHFCVFLGHLKYACLRNDSVIIKHCSDTMYIIGKNLISLKAVIRCFSLSGAPFAKQRLQSAKAKVDQTEALESICLRISLQK